MRLFIIRIIILTGIGVAIPVTFFAQNWTRVGPASSSYGGGLSNVVTDFYTDTINNRLYVSGGFTDTSCHSGGCYNFAYWDNVAWHYIGDSIGVPQRSPFVYYQGKLFSSNFSKQYNSNSSYGYLAYHNLNYWTRTDSVHGLIVALKLINNKLYMVGGFDTVNGVKAYDIAYKDSIGWHAIDTTTWGMGGVNGFNGGFLDVAEYNGDIYIAGNVSSYDGTINKLAKWNGSVWSNVGGVMFSTGSFSGISRLCVYNGELYVGGDFYQPGFSIAKWNGSAWSQLGTGLTDSLGDPGEVEEMIVINNKLVISGSFNFAGGIPANDIVEWDGTKFCAFGGKFDNNEITTFANFNNQIYIAGPIYADTVYICNIGRWVGGSYRDTCGIDAATSIKQLSVSNEQVSVYPNPNNGNFTIETNSTEKQNIQVYDVNGKMVLSQFISGRANIDASSLSDGVYNMSIIGNEAMINKKLVIIR